MSFQLVDSVFIARLGIDPLAVVGFTIPIYQIFIGIQVGIGIATTALISQLLGAEEKDGARELAGLIVLVGSITFLSLVLIIWSFRHQIVLLLGGEPKLLPLVDTFWSVWLAAAFMGAFLYFGYSICRAHGNTMVPGAGMVLTSLLNIGLDPLFIFTFEMGLSGAAWATLCSFSLGALVVYPKILSRQWLSIQHAFHEARAKLAKILSIALPAMVSQLLPALSSMIATYLVASFGTESVAAWGLGIRVEFFSIILVLAMTMSLPQMIGHNYGAKRFDAIASLIVLAIKIVFVWQLILAALMALFNDQISFALAGEEAVADIVSMYITYIPFSYALLGVCIVLISASNAISQPISGLKISFARLFICYLPLLYAGSKLGGLEGLMIGAGIGNILAGLIAVFMFKSAFLKAKKARLNAY